MKYLSFIFLHLAILASVACEPSSPSVDLTKEKAIIRELTTSWFADETRRDMETSLSYLAPEVVIQPEGSPTLIGVDAMRSDYEQFFKLKYKEVVPDGRTVFVAQSGDLAYDIGGWKLVFEDSAGVTESLGKSTIIWRKFDGQWKCVLLSFSSNVP